MTNRRLRDAAKQLQKPAIAGAVDPGRAHDHQLDAAVTRPIAGALLAFELRDLIDVARPERRVLVGRRMLDVAVHANGAAVHDAADAGPRAGVDDRPWRFGVHLSISRLGQARLPVERGDVVDDVHAVHDAEEIVGRLQIANDRFHPGERRERCLRGAPHQDADRVATCDEVPREVAAR